MEMKFSEQITFLHTEDIERVSRFYGDILQMPCVVDQGACRIFHVCGTAYVGFCRHFEKQDTSNTIIITLVSEDVDGWYRHLAEHDVQCEKPPQHNKQFGIYHAFFRDPDGHLLEIQRFDDSQWSATRT